MTDLETYRTIAFVLNSEVRSDIRENIGIPCINIHTKLGFLIHLVKHIISNKKGF